MSLTYVQKNILHSLEDGTMHPKEEYTQSTLYLLAFKKFIVIIDHPIFPKGAIQLTAEGKQVLSENY